MQVKSILLVEDNDNIRRMTELALSQEFDVFLADSGETGIAAAQAEKPDLILLDVRMPDMDGPQMLEILRQNQLTANIPVIFISASIQTHEMQSYKNLDVLGVIERPFDPMNLCSHIKTLSGLSRAEIAMLKKVSTCVDLESIVAEHQRTQAVKENCSDFGGTLVEESRRLVEWSKGLRAQRQSVKETRMRASGKA